MPKVPFKFQIFRAGALVRTETLEQEIVKIGKLSTSHLRLEDESVSRMHAVLDASTAGEVQIVDLGSQRGTFVNGQRVVSKAALKDGDEIVIGETRIIVGIGAPIADVVVPQHDVLAPQGFSPTALPSIPSPIIPLHRSSTVSEAVAAGELVNAEIDDRSGARAIEVLSLFGTTVIEARHLFDPNRGKPTPLTWARLAIGAALLLGGLVASILGYAGMGAFGFLAGVAIGTLAWTRFQDERQSPDFTIGDDPTATFHMPPDKLPSRKFPLVRARQGDFFLVIAPEMAGEIATSGEPLGLADFVQSGRAQASADIPGCHEWPIAPDSRAAIELGENTFLVNSVVRARRVTAGGVRGLDWTSGMYNGISAGAHLLVLLLMLSIPPGGKSLSLDLFGADQRLIRFLVKPPEQKEEQMPEWLKKGPEDDPGGKGQRHKGEEGKMGKKDSKKKEGLYGLKGPQDNPDPHLAKRLAEEAAQNAGVLGILGKQQGSHIASIFGRDSALGTDAENALGGLMGNTIGEAYGVGGLGLVGTGRGGGGTGEGTIGLGTLGTIGKGGGGGNWAGYGRGVGRLGGRRSRAPDVVPGQAEVRGSLDKEIIRRIIRRHLNEVKYCYEKELIANPDLKGRIQVQFTISGAGSVVASVIQNSTMGNPTVEQCIARSVTRWQFPKPVGGGIVIVTYPFLLQATGGEE